MSCKDKMNNVCALREKIEIMREQLHKERLFPAATIPQAFSVDAAPENVRCVSFATPDNTTVHECRGTTEESQIIYDDEGRSVLIRTSPVLSNTVNPCPAQDRPSQIVPSSRSSPRRSSLNVSKVQTVHRAVSTAVDPSLDTTITISPQSRYRVLQRLKLLESEIEGVRRRGWRTSLRDSRSFKSEGMYVNSDTHLKRLISEQQRLENLLMSYTCNNANETSRLYSIGAGTTRTGRSHQPIPSSNALQPDYRPQSISKRSAQSPRGRNFVKENIERVSTVTHKSRKVPPDDELFSGVHTARVRALAAAYECQGPRNRASPSEVYTTKCSTITDSASPQLSSQRSLSTHRPVRGSVKKTMNCSPVLLPQPTIISLRDADSLLHSSKNTTHEEEITEFSTNVIRSGTRASTPRRLFSPRRQSSLYPTQTLVAPELHVDPLAQRERLQEMRSVLSMTTL